MTKMTNECELCKRENQILNFHHFVPRTLHKTKWYKKNFTKEELQKGINICKEDCHKEIHKFISEKDMGKKYNTLEKLLTHPKVKKYVEWLKK